MKNLIRRNSSATFLVFASLLLFLALLVSPVLASGGTVPMSGSFSGVGANFSGNATHLGNFAGVIDNTTIPPNALWTAANGDTLTNITTSFVIDFSAPVAPNVYPYTQTIEFTGGTGRFLNATGSADIAGTIDVVTFGYNGRIYGSISKPNSE